MNTNNTHKRRWMVIGAAVLGVSALFAARSNYAPAIASASTDIAEPAVKASYFLQAFDAVARVPATMPSTQPATFTVNASGQLDDARPARMVLSGVDENNKLNLTVNKTQVINTRVPIKRVSLSQSDAADINTLSPTMLLVTAKKPGVSQLVMWDDNEQTQVVDMQVTADLSVLQGELDKIVPGNRVTATSINGSIVLKGLVNDVQTAERLEALSKPFGNVMNFLEIAGGQQIMLKVQFAEVSRSVTNQLGVNFGLNDGTSIFGNNTGNVSPLGFTTNDDGIINGLGVPDPSSAANIFGVGALGNTAFSYFISALRENNLLRILAEPTLTVQSGEKGDFLAGGEVAIPVPSENGIGIVYKQFGVKLNYEPVVLGNGNIRLKLDTESSQIDETNGTRIAGATVPGFRTRRIGNTVELGEGQTLAVAGLFDSITVANKTVTPLLGDIPVLGALFRSTRYLRRETELVVLITPHIVAPMNPAVVPELPTGKWKHPNELELYFGGDLGGPSDPKEDARRVEPNNKPGKAAPGSRTTTPAGTVSTPAPAPAFIGDTGFTPAAPATKRQMPTKSEDRASASVAE